MNQGAIKPQGYIPFLRFLSAAIELKTDDAIGFC